MNTEQEFIDLLRELFTKCGSNYTKTGQQINKSTTFVWKELNGQGAAEHRDSTWRALMSALGKDPIKARTNRLRLVKLTSVPKARKSKIERLADFLADYPSAIPQVEAFLHATQGYELEE